MSIKDITTRYISRGVLLAKKHSPEILTAAGIVGGVTAAVMASRATLKVEPVVDRLRKDVADIKSVNGKDAKEHNKQAYTRDLSYVYTVNTIEIVKLYAPAVTLGVASIACIVGAHGIMRKRNAALALAYNALEKSYTEYRSRVAEEFGVDKERDIRLGIRDEEVINEDTGKKEKVSTIDPSAHSPYARFFDEYSDQWTKDAEYNLTFLLAQQQYANDKLKARGHVFLNEVYDALGLERTSAGALVGWIYEGEGDSFVDFGIYDASKDAARNFVNGLEKSIMLDFNVDGVIYDKF